MKKIVLLATFLVFGTGVLSAQEMFHFGIKGGVNFSTIGGDDFDDPDSRTSFNIGALAEFPISERFSIQPEVYYSGQGYDIQSNDNADDIEFQLDYINVPVLAKLYIVDGLFVEAGPQIGFNVKSEVDGDPDDFDEGDVDIDNDVFNDVDFGVGLGAGYKFNNGFFVNARYNWGLSDVFNSDELGGFDINARNRVFQAGVGFMF